jgi:hypothetical protein
MGAMCLVADLAVLAVSLATIFGVSWYQNKRKGKSIRKSTEEEKEFHKEKLLTEQID